MSRRREGRRLLTGAPPILRGRVVVSLLSSWMLPVLLGEHSRVSETCNNRRVDPVESGLERAKELASGRRTHPNPTVGCVILDAEGKAVGEGWHRGPGSAHAEVVALAAAGDAALGGTAIVTLEPCSHHGQTPPCTDSLIRAGVSRVVFGAADPDERVAGGDALAAAGLRVDGPVDRIGCEALDPAYFHHRRTGLPRITVKSAATLDGVTAAEDGSSQWITGPEARADAHAERARRDAVVVGAGTVMADNPRLDVRLPGYEGPQPRAVVIAGSRRLPKSARLAGRNPLVICPAGDQPWGEVVRVAAGIDGKPDPEAALRAIADRGYLDVLVEGGARLAGSLWRAGLVEEFVLYLGPLVAGGRGLPILDGPFGHLSDATPVHVREAAVIGENVRIRFTRS